jgi:hypothetical protein
MELQHGDKVIAKIAIKDVPTLWKNWLMKYL